ncbi:MAG: TetR/AcrR family transcriptional regulator [Gammaproteobacteria bacterium]
MVTQVLADQILDTALSLAESSSWEDIHLYRIAEELEISLEQIRQNYPQKDDLVEAWFDRADSALLKITPSPDFMNLSVRERLHYAMMTWFEALAPHRRITGEMLLYKLEFGHIHLQALGVMRISRTVQWFREAARIDTTGLRRILEETGTTTIYLMSFARWLNDDSPGFIKTRESLDKLLLNAEQFAKKIGFY